MIGGAIGAATGDPFLAVVGGISSHHLADTVLHTDTGTFRVREESDDRPRLSRIELAVVVADLMIGGLLLIALTHGHPYWWVALLGGLAGITPDLVDNVPFWSPRFRATAFGRAYHAFHSRFHRTAPRTAWVPGLLTQLVVWLVAAWIVRGSHFDVPVQAAPAPGAVSVPTVIAPPPRNGPHSR
jgi:hypothetical protein